MLFGAMWAPMASPKRMARSTAPRFRTGSTPGRARSTAQAWRLGSAPKAVLAPEKILEAVLSWAWTSSPMTTSQGVRLMSFPSCVARSVAVTAMPIHEDRPEILGGVAGALAGALTEGHGDLVALLPHAHAAAIAGQQLDMGRRLDLSEIGHDNELSVIAALWDLYDAAADGADQ